MKAVKIFRIGARCDRSSLSKLVRMSDSHGGADPEDPKAGAGSGAEAVGDALRNAVERTIAATAGSASETRERAQGLLDDVVRRGQSAREEVARRGEEASTRLAEAISDLRAADDEDLSRLADRLAAAESRIAALEAALAVADPDETPPEVEPNPRVEVDVRPSESHGQGDPEA